MFSTRVLLAAMVAISSLSQAMHRGNGPADHKDYYDKRNAALIYKAISKTEQLERSMSLFCKKCQSRSENKEVFGRCRRMIQDLDHLIRAGQRETHAAIRNQNEFLEAFDLAKAMIAALGRLDYCDHGANPWHYSTY